MALPRAETTQGIQDELEAFEDLVRSLDARQLMAPSRCEGWTVGDVAAHVIGTMSAVTSLQLDGLGTPEVTQRIVDERRGKTADDLADELAGVRKQSADLLAAFDDGAWAAPSPGGFDFTLGYAIEALWYDAYLHADDIRDALGQPSVRSDAGLRVSLSHIADTLTSQGYGDATLALDGHVPFDVGDGGKAIRGDAFEFVKAATGRGDPAAFGCDGTINIYR